MKLHYRKYGEGQPLIILHGLFGSSDNWQTLGKKFAENFEVYLVDQRNHGHSPKSNEFNYQLLSDDLYKLITDLELENITLIGHSMGGKTVMHFAQEHPLFIKKLIVVDIGPKAYPMHHDIILAGLNSLDLSTIKSRGQADKQLSKFIEDIGVKQFLLKNLYWIEKGQLGWRINIPVLEKKMPDIVAAIPDKIVETHTLFIRGEKSNYIVEDDFQNIYDQFPNSEIETIYDAGHWVHAENPFSFYNMVLEFSR
ncbi:MAG: alpha/beta fold hydrolase [Flavobacteriales bacterium]|nr:alpha/beta fold hydrolase [Flavobacteriales bacterium]